MLPSITVSADKSSRVCENMSLGGGYFRAYGNPKPVSNQAFTINGGKKRYLNELSDPRALLVNFWTTWCRPCREEMPSMDRLQGRVSYDDLMIIPLVRDGKGLSEAIRFYKTFNIKNLPVAADRFGKISRDHHIGALPQTLLVDKKGLVKGIIVGGVDWESKKVLDLLNSCLNIDVNEEA